MEKAHGIFDNTLGGFRRPHPEPRSFSGKWGKRGLNRRPLTPDCLGLSPPGSRPASPTVQAPTLSCVTVERRGHHFPLCRVNPFLFTPTIPGTMGTQAPPFCPTISSLHLARLHL